MRYIFSRHIFARAPRFRLVLAILALALAGPLSPPRQALAADPVFPPGARLGLVPPKGMQPAQAFQGFGDPQNNAGIILNLLPARAYGEIEQSVTAPALKKEGIVQQKREAITTPFGRGFLIVARQTAEGEKLRKWLLVVKGAPAKATDMKAAAGKAAAGAKPAEADKAPVSALTATAEETAALVTVQIPETAAKHYPDAAIRAALATLTIRDTVPDAEHLSLLPFELRTLSDFRIAAVMPGRAVLLSDAAPGGKGDDRSEAGAPPDGGEAPHLVITLGPDAPSQTDDRDAFARRIFGGVGNLKEVKIEVSEPLRIGGAFGHQIMAEAKDQRTDKPLRVVQWLRFGGGTHMQIVGTAPREEWTEALNRFRAVRDGISTR